MASDFLALEKEKNLLNFPVPFIIGGLELSLFPLTDHEEFA